jgi:diguanylate cyclase (GGDEF)-like protein
MRLDRIPQHFVYSAAGLMLAVGAPAGMVLLHALRARQWSMSWMMREVTGSWRDYLYIGGSTAVAFALWGRVLGFKAEDLSRLASEDSLTGLLNARGFRRRLGQELAQAARAGEPLSVMLCDLDGLKAINDTYGHDAGDRALRSVGDIIRRCVRLMDSSARTGGDEFAVILPSAGYDEALVLGERIRRRVALGLSHVVTGEKAATISIGIACCRPGACAATAESIVSAADDALYEAKRTGRNRLAVRRLSNHSTPSSSLVQAERYGHCENELLGTSIQNDR